MLFISFIHTDTLNLQETHIYKTRACLVYIRIFIHTRNTIHTIYNQSPYCNPLTDAISSTKAL